MANKYQTYWLKGIMFYIASGILALITYFVLLNVNADFFDFQNKNTMFLLFFLFLSIYPAIYGWIIEQVNIRVK